MELEALIKIFSESLEELPSTPIDSTTRFKDLKAWDSLAVLTVADSVEIESGVLLKKEDFLESESIAELQALILKKGGISKG